MMKRLLLITIIAMPLITFAQNEKGELKGVVTYFFNDNYGSKPDVGAKVTILRIDLTSEISPEEVKYDSELVNLKQYIAQLGDSINKETSDLANVDTTQKVAQAKNKSIQTSKGKLTQTVKEKSLSEELDKEQQQYEKNLVDERTSFNKTRKSDLDYGEFYNKQKAEIRRHYQQQINIIDTFSKLSGESGNKLRQRRLLIKNELNVANKAISEERLKTITSQLEYEVDKKKSNYESKIIMDNIEASKFIGNFKMAEMARHYLSVAPTKKFKNEQIQHLKDLNAYPEERFNELDNKVHRMVYDIEYGKDKIVTTVDGNGHYSVKLEPGMYYLVIRSKGRKDHSWTDGEGQISGIDIIHIKSNEVTEKSEDYKGGY